MYDGNDHIDNNPIMGPPFAISGCVFLIILHVILAYVLSMGMPPSTNIS